MSNTKYLNSSLQSVFEALRFNPDSALGNSQLDEQIQKANNETDFFKCSVFSTEALEKMSSANKSVGIMFSHVPFKYKNRKSLYSVGVGVGLDKQMNYLFDDLHISVPCETDAMRGIYDEFSLVADANQKVEMLEKSTISKLLESNSKVRAVIKQRNDADQQMFKGVFFYKKFIEGVLKFCKKNKCNEVILIPLLVQYPDEPVDSDFPNDIADCVSFVLAPLLEGKPLPLNIKKAKRSTKTKSNAKVNAFVISGRTYPKKWRDTLTDGETEIEFP